MTIQEAVERFLAAIRAEGKSSETVRWYRSTLAIFVRSVGDDWSTVEAVRDFLASLDVGPATFGAYHRCLRGFFARCAEWGWVAGNPMLAIRRPRLPNDKPKAITREDFGRLVQAAGESPYHLALILLLADTGIRGGELVGLRLGDVSLTERQALVRGKGSKQRVVTFTPMTAGALRRWLDVREVDSPWLFPGRDPAEHLRRDSLHHILTRFARLHGISGRVNPHSFRHFLALEWVANDYGDVFSLADFLGHSDISVTKRYVRFRTEHLREKHARVSPVATLLTEDVNGKPVALQGAPSANGREKSPVSSPSER